VIDFLRDSPPQNGKLNWKHAEKLASVFGFPSVESLHFTELTEEQITAVDPAFIILSPGGSNLQYVNIEEAKAAMLTAVECGVPVIGICLGHQGLAMCYGGELAALVEVSSDGKHMPLNE
jgi:anthranilate/para-aminobenzoate synthase component II